MSESHSTAAARDYSHALRVTFAYDASTITLKRVKRVAMRVPASAMAAPDEGSVGYWLALEDEAGAVIYHLPVHQPIREDYEVFPGPQDGKPSRVPAAEMRPTSSEGTFEVLVPDFTGAARLVLHGPPRGEAAPRRTRPERGVRLTTHRIEELRGLAVEGGAQ